MRNRSCDKIRPLFFFPRCLWFHLSLSLCCLSNHYFSVSVVTFSPFFFFFLNRLKFRYKEIKLQQIIDGKLNFYFFFFFLKRRMDISERQKCSRVPTNQGTRV